MLRLFCFASFFVSMLSLKPRPFVQSSFDMRRSGRHAFIFIFIFFLSFLFIWRCRFFRVFFIPFITAFSLNGECSERALAFSAAIHVAMKWSAPCSAVLHHSPSRWAAACSRPLLVGVDVESSEEVVQETPHPLFSRRLA